MIYMTSLSKASKGNPVPKKESLLMVMLKFCIVFIRITLTYQEFVLLFKWLLITHVK